MLIGRTGGSSTGRRPDWVEGSSLYGFQREVGGTKGSLYALRDVAIDDEVEEFSEGSNLDGCATALLLCPSVRRS